MPLRKIAKRMLTKMFVIRPCLLMRKLFPAALWRLTKDRKVVYLTFDDGPIPELTPRVLDVLREKNVKATFFCIGENVCKYPQLYRQLIAEGHEVGNHTFNHVQSLKSSKEDFLENVDLARQEIESSLFRPPHGFIKRTHMKALSERYTLVMWDVLSQDYAAELNVQQVVNRVMRYTRNGSIVVFHDSLKAQERVLGALPQVIDGLRDAGFDFACIPQVK